MKELFRNVDMSCLAWTDGNYPQALQLQDCSWFEYLWRMMNLKDYHKMKNDEIEKQRKKPKRKPI